MSPETPEKAIANFESIHDLRVTVHDLRGSLWPFLLPDRFQHSQPVCQAVKRLGRQPLCMAFSVRRLEGEIGAEPEGRIQVCHAGLVEWTVPTFKDEALEWVIFAGVRRAGPSLTQVVWDDQHPLPPGFWEGGLDQPALVEADEAEQVLEHLRQLTARLWLWRLQSATAPVGTVPGRGMLPQSVAQRRTLIQRFIVERHAGPVRLSDLASRLGLSEWRTSHVVRDSCNATFQQLLSQARLRTALGLLRHSELSVVEVAINSGFEDARHFHRLFRREMQTTPLQYRKSARG